MAGITNKAKLVMKQMGKPFDAGQSRGGDLETITRGLTSHILSPLVHAGGKDLGIEFPLTPTIQMSHSANYGTYDVAGSIAQQNYYMNTPNPSMSVTAMFPANTIEEAKYSLAALNFLKTCTKSDFGAQSITTAGTPPPILKFSCYGTVHAKNVPVVLRNFTYTLPEDTDYVEVDLDGEKHSVPTLLLISVELVPQQVPKRIKDSFNIRTFASGSGLKGGNPGGFI